MQSTPVRGLFKFFRECKKATVDPAGANQKGKQVSQSGIPNLQKTQQLLSQLTTLTGLQFTMLNQAQSDGALPDAQTLATAIGEGKQQGRRGQASSRERRASTRCCRR